MMYFQKSNLDEKFRAKYKTCPDFKKKIDSVTKQLPKTHKFAELIEFVKSDSKTKADK